MQSEEKAAPVVECTALGRAILLGSPEQPASRKSLTPKVTKVTKKNSYKNYTPKVIPHRTD